MLIPEMWAKLRHQDDQKATHQEEHAPRLRVLQVRVKTECSKGSPTRSSHAGGRWLMLMVDNWVP